MPNSQSTLPEEVEAVFREFRVCELTTLSRDGTPITWPTSARYLPEKGQFIITTSIGLSNKAFHIRRNPHVSLLFSYPVASGLTNPSAVLVQGDAVAPDKILTSVDGLEDYWLETIFRRQPASSMIILNPLMRKMTDWYYMRLLITITPRKIVWWPEGDFSRAAQSLEVAYVG